jgi:hypothetical protein
MQEESATTILSIEKEEVISHEDTRLLNIRLWCVTGFILFIITDVLLIYPKFSGKPLIPNKVCIICEAVVTYAGLGISYYSYKKK